MLSRCFHFRVSEICVSSLFLLPFISAKPYCISVTYEELTGFQEEYNDDLLVSILRYNKICTIRGWLLQPPPYRIITSKLNIVIFFLTSCSLLSQHWGMSLTLNIAFLIFMIQNYNISSEARTNVLLNFAKSQQMKAKDNFLLSSFAFSPVKLYHRNSMILHGRKGETEIVCLRIVYANGLQTNSL